MARLIRQIREIRSQTQKAVPSEWLVCKANSVETERMFFLLAADFADFADETRKAEIAESVAVKARLPLRQFFDTTRNEMMLLRTLYGRTFPTAIS